MPRRFAEKLGLPFSPLQGKRSHGVNRIFGPFPARHSEISEFPMDRDFESRASPCRLTGLHRFNEEVSQDTILD